MSLFGIYNEMLQAYWLEPLHPRHGHWVRKPDDATHFQSAEDARAKIVELHRTYHTSLPLTVRRFDKA